MKMLIPTKWRLLNSRQVWNIEHAETVFVANGNLIPKQFGSTREPNPDSRSRVKTLERCSAGLEREKGDDGNEHAF